MRIIFDARVLQMYPVGKPGFKGGTETMVERLAHGLAGKGHTVHVVTPDLEREEQRGPAEWWWGPLAFPKEADAVVAVHSLEAVSPDSGYNAPLLVCATNGLGAFLGPDDEWAKYVDAWPVFSACHADLLSKHHKNVDPGKCHVTGLGIDLGEYESAWVSAAVYGHTRTGLPVDDAAATTLKKRGRIFVSNDPARGLWHVLDVFDALKKKVPHATLHVGYAFDKQLELRRWFQHALAEMMWECKRRLDTTEGVVNLGDLSPEQVVREHLESQVHVWPSDPPNVGSQIHGLSQLEAAAAGNALVLSDIEAFPEVFGEAATLLPLPGTFVPPHEDVTEGRRINAEDWAEVVAELMLDPQKWAEASRKSRALSEQHDWSRVINAWDSMLTNLGGK